MSSLVSYHGWAVLSAVHREMRPIESGRRVTAAVVGLHRPESRGIYALSSLLSAWPGLDYRSDRRRGTVSDPETVGRRDFVVAPDHGPINLGWSPTIVFAADDGLFERLRAGGHDGIVVCEDALDHGDDPNAAYCVQASSLALPSGTEAQIQQAWEFVGGMNDLFRRCEWLSQGASQAA